MLLDMDNAASLLHQLHSDNCKKSNDSSNKTVNIWRLECAACISEGDRVNVMINWNLCIVENIGTIPALVK